MKRIVALAAATVIASSAFAFAGAHIQVSKEASPNAANQGTVNAAGKIAKNDKAAQAVVKKPGQN